ncbi:abcA6, partial [Symbiodinium pilosum]
ESGNFPQLFESLERNPQRYGIELFGVSVTTLEEVFLKVGRDHTEADIAEDERLQQASFVRQISTER